MFSIIILTFNNLEYLKFCLKSINKNSKYKHQVIPHVNVEKIKVKEYLENRIMILPILIIMRVFVKE